MPSAVSNTSYNLGTIPLLAEVTHVDNRNNSFNTTGKFPIYLKSSFLDRSTAVIKHGDSISVTMSNPGGGAVSFVSGSQGTTSQQYPPPLASGNTFSLNWPSSLSDNSFQTSGNNVSFANDTAWPFKGLPNTGNYGSVSNSIVGGGTTRTGHQYSRKIRISVVTGQIAFDGGAQTKTITQGDTTAINIIGSNITGLPRISHSVPASGGVNLNNPSYYNQYTNKLYVSVWSHTTSAIVSNASASGRFSNPTTGWIGIVRDAAAGTGSGVSGTGNNAITFNPAGLAAGTYSIYLNHNSPSFGGDTRTKQDSRMWRITLTVNAAPTGNPNAFVIVNSAGTIPQNSTITSAATTLTGMGAASTITQLTTGFTAFVNGNAVALNGAVPQNATITLQTTSAAYGQSVSGTIRIGTTTSSPAWTVQTMAEPAGGTGVGAISGNATQGLAVLKPGATTQVFNQNMRVGTLLAYNSVALTTSGTTVYTPYITVPDNVGTTSNAWAVLYQGAYTGNASHILHSLEYGTGANAGKFRFVLATPSGSGTATAYYSIVRY